MIIQEELKIGSNFFIHTYSDAGYKIERDGVKYVDAIDPQFLGREYTETTELIEDDTEVAMEEDTLTQNLDNEEIE